MPLNVSSSRNVNACNQNLEFYAVNGLDVLLFPYRACGFRHWRQAIVDEAIQELHQTWRQ